MEDRVAQEDGLLSVTDLVRMFEESEEATYEARKQAERDRDYHDNKQITAEERAALRKRGQPDNIANRIKRKIDYLVGLEKQQRIDPRALPRTPLHDNDADSASQALRYVADEQDYDAKRSRAWRNLLIEGVAGIRVYVEPGYDGEMQVKVDRVSWDRLFYDPHSMEADFSDAGYLGIVVWLDYNDAVRRYPEGVEALDSTLNSTSYSDTYDDKPKYMLWADRKRKRVRICQIWIKQADQWYFAEYTKGGILKAGASPYYTDKGESDGELIFQSAYVDRDNNRYGLVREMIGPQDEVNKRRSKALHLLNTAQIVYEQGAIDDPDKTRREAGRPDGQIEVNPGFFDRFRFETRTDLAASHFSLLQEAKNEIDLMGPNAAMQGEKVGDTASASGKAIIASQQGGMIQMGDLLDNLRHMDQRVFRAVWSRIRQFWTGPKWIRTTDDERDIRWVALNMLGEGAMVAELDCDIIIDEAPDSVTPALEQWEGLVNLASNGVAIPPDVLIEAAPNLKNKDKLLERMQQGDPGAQQAQQLQLDQLAAKIEDILASAEQKRAAALKSVADANIGAVRVMQDGANAEAGREVAAMPAGDDGVDGGQPAMPSPAPDPVAIAIERMSESVLISGQMQSAAISEMTRALTAPKQIVRGPDGRPAGVETMAVN